MPKIKASKSQRTLACLGVLVCSGLLILSVPRFIASIYALYPEAAYNQTDSSLNQAIYEKSISDLEQALSWSKDPQYFQKLSYFYLKLSKLEEIHDQTQQQPTLLKAQSAMTNSLALSPVDANAWLQLADIDSQLNKPKQQIIEALRLSFYAGRVEPELALSRLAFTYDFYEALPEDMQKTWQKQALIAWTFNPSELLQFIELHPEAKDIVLKGFVNTPDEATKLLSQLVVSE